MLKDYKRQRSVEMPAEPPFSPPSARQMAFMERHGLLPPGGRVSSSEAWQIISRFIASRRRLGPTQKQEVALRRHGLWRDGMNRGHAVDAIKRSIDAASGDEQSSRPGAG